MCEKPKDIGVTTEEATALEAIAAHVLRMVGREEWFDITEDGSFAIEVTHARTLPFTEKVQVAEYRVWSWSTYR